MITLLFLVIFAATFILFSEEMSVVLKKWYGIYWVRVAVPLLVMSWIWIWNDEFIPLLLAWLQARVVFLNVTIAGFFPQGMQWVARATSLFILASLPAWFLHWRFHRTVITKAKTEMIANVYVFVWLFFTVVLLA
jgi:hypothetical protein